MFQKMSHTHWGKPMYLAIKSATTEVDDYGKPIVGYATPVEMQLNYQPIKAEEKAELFGNNVEAEQKAVILIDNPLYNPFIDGIEGSIAYLNGASPLVKPYWDNDTTGDVEPRNGYWGNYEITGILVGNLAKRVFFKRTKTTGV